MKDTKYSWNLTDLYKSDDDPQMEKDLKEVIKKNYKFINKWKDRSDYLKDPKILKDAFPFGWLKYKSVGPRNCTISMCSFTTTLAGI